MNDDEKIKILKSKDLRHGDFVYFNVENQSCYCGPLSGILHLKGKPFILCVDYMIVEINEYLSAYINTIRKIN